MSEIVAAYDYRNEKGELAYQNCRFEPKDFRQRRPDGKGGWFWNLNGVPRVLYRLPELISSSIQDWVLVVEGEKDVESLRTLGFTATTSGSADSWKDELAKHFAGRLVCIIPDADKAGRRYAETIIDSVRGVAAEVRLAEVPGAHKDITDWIEAHDAAEPSDLAVQIHTIIDTAKSVKATAAGQDPGRPKPRLGGVIVRVQRQDMKRVRWLIPGHLALGKLAILVGLPSCGKSLFVTWLVAAMQRRDKLPDLDGEPVDVLQGGALLVTCEDDPEDTIAPRLAAYGVDPASLAIYKGTRIIEADGLNQSAFLTCRCTCPPSRRF